MRPATISVKAVPGLPALETGTANARHVWARTEALAWYSKASPPW